MLITPNDPECNNEALAVAERLAGTAVRLAADTDRQRATEARVAVLEVALRDAQARIPPKNPIWLMGPGWIRFDERGGMWVLSSGEKGWAAFGYRLEGWDDLFRRYAVHVTAHGVDETGMWWQIENSDERLA